MNYRIILKYILRIVSYTVAGLIVTWIGLIIYLSKPHIIELKEVRTTGKLETVRVSWGHACGEEFISEGLEGTKLTLLVPEGGITPGDTIAAVKDNIFIITGYRYKRVNKNLFSGKITEVRSRRFDVVKWHVVPPYEVYVNNKDALTRKINTPLGWSSSELEPKFASYSRPKTGGC